MGWSVGMLVVFLIIFPFAVFALFAIAIHIDPFTGHFRRLEIRCTSRSTSQRTIMLSRHLFGRTIIEEMVHHLSNASDEHSRAHPAVIPVADPSLPGSDGRAAFPVKREREA
jgi:hypothetical protein